MAAKHQGTRVVIGPARFSFVNVFTAKLRSDAKEGEKPKYSLTLLIPKTDKALLTKVTQAMDNARAAHKDLTKLTLAQLKHTALRDGDDFYAIADDDKKHMYEAYQGCMFVNASNTMRPGVLEGPNKEVPIDETSVYSGSYGYATVDFFGYIHPSGGKGVSASLGNVWKTKDGEALGATQVAAEVDFEGVEPAFEDDDDLMG